jgi:hypothetical protein
MQRGGGEARLSHPIKGTKTCTLATTLITNGWHVGDAAVGLIFRSVRFMMRAKFVETDRVPLEYMHLTFALTKCFI